MKAIIKLCVIAILLFTSTNFAQDKTKAQLDQERFARMDLEAEHKIQENELKEDLAKQKSSLLAKQEKEIKQFEAAVPNDAKGKKLKEEMLSRHQKEKLSLQAREARLISSTKKVQLAERESLLNKQDPLRKVKKKRENFKQDLTKSRNDLLNKQTNKLKTVGNNAKEKKLLLKKQKKERVDLNKKNKKKILAYHTKEKKEIKKINKKPDGKVKKAAKKVKSKFSRNKKKKN